MALIMGLGCWGLRWMERLGDCFCRMLCGGLDSSLILIIRSMLVGGLGGGVEDEEVLRVRDTLRGDVKDV